MWALRAGGVQLWHAHDGSDAGVLDTGAAFVYAIAFTPDGQRVAVAMNDTVTLWDTRTRSRLAWGEGGPAAVTLAALVLTYGEPGAPFAVWLSLVGAIALQRVAPAGRIQRIARLWFLASAAVLVIEVVPFARDQVRDALHPQAAELGVVYPDRTAPMAPPAPTAQGVPGGYVGGVVGGVPEEAPPPPPRPPGKGRTSPRSRTRPRGNRKPESAPTR